MKHILSLENRYLALSATVVALALLEPRAAEPQGVAITDTEITVGGKQVLTTADAMPL
jgi:hypothetical protein